MNIASLIGGAPELVDGLKGLGLTDVNIADMAEGIGQQLGGDDGFDFTDLLTTLQADSFLSRIDAPALAEKALISPGLAQQALGLLAPAIADFGGSKLGVLGKLAGGLFGRK